jgi:hypothetical protein
MRGKIGDRITFTIVSVLESDVKGVVFLGPVERRDFLKVKKVNRSLY